MKKHILVISQYFFPEQFRINDICEEWVKRGYKVTVVTGIPNYPQGKFYDGFGVFKQNKQTYRGIEIIRLPIVPRGNNSLMLALNYASFVVSGYFWQLFTNLKPDNVFIFEVSPMTQALPGVWLSKRRNIPCYIYVQDLWPENVEIITGIKNKTIINTIGKMVDYIYKNSTGIFTTSRSFVEAIISRGVEKEKVNYWPQYAEDFYVPVERQEIEEIPNTNNLNITFTGNIGQAQGLDILVEAAKILKEDYQVDNVTFNIVGDGRYKEKLKQNITDNEVNGMFHFIGKQKPEKIPDILASSDIAFLSLIKDPLFSKTIPAKLQSYMACGKPILAAADGETSTIILESECGICVPSGDACALAKGILEYLEMPSEKIAGIGKKARSYYDNNFNKSLLLNEMDRNFTRNILEA